MKELSAELLAAQRSQGRVTPAVSVVVRAFPCEWPLLEEPELYASETVENARQAAVYTRQGRVIRLKVDAGGTVRRCRVTSPDTASASAWTTWASHGSGQMPLGPVALCASDVNDDIWSFVVSASGRIVYSRFSSDDGASWASSVAVVTYPSGTTVKALAACCVSGIPYVFLLVEPGGTDPDDRVACLYGDGAGGWVGPVTQSELRYNATWLDACAQDTSVGTRVGVYVCDGSPRRISMAEWNQVTKAWAGGTVLWEATPGSGYDYEGIGVTPRTGAIPRYWYWWVERESALGWRRLKVSTGASRLYFGDWMTYDWHGCGGGYGVRVVRTAQHAFVMGAWWVRRARLYTGATGQDVDVTGRVVRVDLDDRAEEPGRSEVWLDNKGGRFAEAGSGADLALRVGSAVDLKLGYWTSLGEELVPQPPRWIDGLRYVEGQDGASYLVLELIDGWGYLERWRARRVEEVAGQNLSSVLTRAASLVTGKYVSNLHAKLTRTVPRWTMAAGSSWASWVRRAGLEGGVLLRIGRQGDGYDWSTVVLEAVSLGGSAAPYTYGHGAEEHPPREVEDGPRVQAVTTAEVLGAGVYGDAWDTGRAYLQGREAGLALSVQQVTVAGEAATVAANVLERQKREAWRGALLALPNVGLEIGDVIQVKSRWGNVKGLRQVWRIRTVLDRRGGRAEWLQRVEYRGA